MSVVAAGVVGAGVVGAEVPGVGAFARVRAAAGVAAGATTSSGDAVARARAARFGAAPSPSTTAGLRRWRGFGVVDPVSPASLGLRRRGGLGRSLSSIRRVYPQ
ncbi:MAG TPA: hypothetical protein VFS55_14085, partial [Dokdonella sp.]|nr:hypothetical protein [Dokdonella sp.]